MIIYLICGGVLILAMYTIVNLLKKVEKLEQIATTQKVFIEQLREVINLSSNRLTEIDEKGTFSSDDEIGWFFNNIKEIQDELNTFKGE